MKKIIAGFNPAWGAAVMGTGVLSILSVQAGDVFKILAIVLFGINALILLYSLVCWILMWFVAPKKIEAIVNNASMIVFLPTVPIGLVVFASNLMALRGDYFPGLGLVLPAVLWIVASLVIVALAVHFLDRMFSSPGIEIQHSTFGWLIPPVALLVIPLGAPAVVGAFSPPVAETLVLFSFASWGAGFFAYLFVNAAVTHRYFFHELPVSQMTPSVWVGLGPLGAGAAGLLSLTRVADGMKTMQGIGNISFALAVLMWGFGLIWYLVSLVLTMRKTIFERIPYTMGWWAFTFPLGAFALATRLLAVRTGIVAIDVIFWILFANLWAFWVITAYRTASSVVRSA